MSPRWFNLEPKFWKLWPCLFFWTAHNFANGPHFVALTQLRATKTGSNICCTHLSYTFSESWVRKDSVGTCPEKFSRWKFSGTERFTKKFRFSLISVSPCKKKYVYHKNQVNLTPVSWGPARSTVFLRDAKAGTWAFGPVRNKKSRNGDTLGPVELILWPEQGNQGDWREQDG